MPEEITIQELEKASRNLERLAEFIGARRGWTLASGDQTAATYAREAAEGTHVRSAGIGMQQRIVTIFHAQQMSRFVDQTKPRHHKPVTKKGDYYDNLAFSSFSFYPLSLFYYNY